MFFPLMRTWSLLMSNSDRNELMQDCVQSYDSLTQQQCGEGGQHSGRHGQPAGFLCSCHWTTALALPGRKQNSKRSAVGSCNCQWVWPSIAKGEWWKG